jgi:hypothetical protein
MLGVIGGAGYRAISPSSIPPACLFSIATGVFFDLYLPRPLSGSDRGASVHVRSDTRLE